MATMADKPNLLTRQQMLDVLHGLDAAATFECNFLRNISVRIDGVYVGFIDFRTGAYHRNPTDKCTAPGCVDGQDYSNWDNFPPDCGVCNGTGTI